jgi:hypothetical protein
VGTRWWHQSGNALDQLQWREAKLVDPGTTLVIVWLAVLVGQHLFGIKVRKQSELHRADVDRHGAEVTALLSRIALGRQPAPG